MLKKSIFVLLGILAMTSIVFAGIAQQQNFDIGATNTMSLWDGLEMTAGANLATVHHWQNAIGSCGLSAREVERVELEQGGYAAGIGVLFSVDQHETASGDQVQLIDSCVGPMAQGQMFYADMGQELSQLEAGGIATGSQSFLGTHRQEMVSLSATMAESQQVGVDQSTVVSGGPVSNAAVTSGVVVHANQAQASD